MTTAAVRHRVKHCSLPVVVAATMLHSTLLSRARVVDNSKGPFSLHDALILNHLLSSLNHLEPFPKDFGP